MSNAFLSGSYQFNNSPLYNFQLNRVVLWNHGDPAEVAARGKEITDFASWERVLKELSYQAERRKELGRGGGLPPYGRVFYGAGHAGEPRCL